MTPKAPGDARRPGRTARHAGVDVPGAAHDRGWPSLPKSTSTRRSCRPSGCGTTSSIRAAITPRMSRPGSSTPSTSSPTWLSAADEFVGRCFDGRELPIQDSGARISAIRTARGNACRRPRVLIVVDAVADLHDPLDARSRTRTPCHSSGSMPTASNTFGSTIPQPPSSIQPVREHTRASFAVAEHAADRQLRRRLGEGEVVRAEARADGFVAEQALDERLDRAEQVAERDAAVDRKAFDLVEHRRVARPRASRCGTCARARRRRSAARSLPSCGPARARCACAASPARRGRAARRACPAWRAPGAPGGKLSASKLYQSSSTSGPSATLVAEPDEDVLELAPDPRDGMQVPTDAAVPARGQIETVASARDRPPRSRRSQRAGARSRRRSPTCSRTPPCRRRAGPRAVDVLIASRISLSRRRPCPTYRRSSSPELAERRPTARAAVAASDCASARAAAAPRPGVTVPPAAGGPPRTASTVPAIATLSDSARGSSGCVTCPSRFGRARRECRTPRCRARSRPVR